MSANKQKIKEESTKPTTEAEKPNYQAKPSALNEADYVRAIYNYKPKAGIPYKELLKREFWVHVSERIKRGDIIEVFPEDGEYFAKLLVTNVGKGWVAVFTLSHKLINAPDLHSMPLNKFEVKWMESHTKWSVVRKRDGVILREGFEEKTEAQEWLNKNIKQIS